MGTGYEPAERAQTAPTEQPKPHKGKRRKFGFGPDYGRDPFKRTLKSTATRSRDKRQLAFDLAALSATRRREPAQIDLVEYIAGLGAKS